jgi:iron complex outermembrane receptor protein
MSHAVAVAGREEIQRGGGGAFLEEVVRALPGLQVQNRFNLASGERISVRGFGSRAQFGIRGIRVVVDGIPATLPDGQTAIDHIDFSSLGRVELVRGPGASLYGNAAGGVLHFQSLPPSLQGGQVAFRTYGGSHGLRTYAGNITDTVGTNAFRIGVSRFSYDGFRSNPLTEDGTHYGAADRTLLNGAVTRPVGQGHLRLVFNGMELNAENPGSLSKSSLAEEGPQAYPFNIIQQTREEIEQGQVGITWKGPLRGAEVEVSSWGIRRNFEGRIPPAVVAFHRWSMGLRVLFQGSIEAGPGTLALGGGLEAERQDDDRRNWENEEGRRGALALDQQEYVANLGFFLQGRMEMNPGVAVTAGLRMDRFRFRAEDRFLQDGSDDSGQREMSAFSPSLGLVWKPRSGLEMFGSVATSFDTPTTTELANRPTGIGGLNPDLDPTRGVTLEGGVRVRIFRGWSLEGTVFRTKLSDELVPFEVPQAPGRSFFRNAGSSIHRGWEASAEGHPFPWAQVRMAYTRVDARFDSFTVGNEDFSGNRIPGLAPHRLDGRFLLNLASAFAELRGLYQGEVPVDDENALSSSPFFLLDVMLGLEGVRAGRASLSPVFSVANLLDRGYSAAVVVNAFGSRYFEPGPGRTYRIGLSLTFEE